MPPTPAPRATRRRARLAIAALVVVAVSFLTLVALPPWWSGPRSVLFVAGGVGLVGLVAYGRSARLLPTRLVPGLRLAPRRWLVNVSMLVAVVGTVAIGLLGPDVVASHTLPAAPERVSAIRTYRACAGRHCPRMVAFDAAGTLVDTAYPTSLFGMPAGGAGVTFAYDPAAPTHVMPDRDFRFGRGPASAYAASALALLLAWFAGVALNSVTRTRRGLAALAGEAIVAVEAPTKDRCIVTFTSGARHTFNRPPSWTPPSVAVPCGTIHRPDRVRAARSTGLRTDSPRRRVAPGASWRGA